MSRALLPWALGVVLSLGLSRPATAQDGAPLVLSVRQGDGSPLVHLGDIFQDPGLVRALHAGLPLRILVRVELWKDGFFDSQRGREEWRASVLYDPLESRYRIGTGATGAVELALDSLPAVVQALHSTLEFSLRPRERGRYYYLGQVEMETLSPSDLDELQRWLRGDLAPAVRGERSAGSAVGRGMHRMVVRMLGIPARRYRLRSEPFDFEAAGTG